MHLIATSSAPSVVTVAVDVSAYKLNLMSRELSFPGASAEWKIANRTEPITSTLLAIRERAQACGMTHLRVIVEPTGIARCCSATTARLTGAIRTRSKPLPLEVA